MNLLESLLDAITRLEGDALVMHVGEKPYVVTTSASMSPHRGPLAWGQVELSSRILTPEAVDDMVTQILPAGERQTLEEYGAVEHAVQSVSDISDQFTVVAARGGQDIWLELRRHRAEKPAATAVAAPEPEIVPEVRPAEPQVIQPQANAVAPPPLAPRIETVEEEQQRAPTEEDVDAMLAATAAELLSSDLAVAQILQDEGDREAGSDGYAHEADDQTDEGTEEEVEVPIDDLLRPAAGFDALRAQPARSPEDASPELQTSETPPAHVEASEFAVRATSERPEAPGYASSDGRDLPQVAERDEPAGADSGVPTVPAIDTQPAAHFDAIAEVAAGRETEISGPSSAARSEPASASEASQSAPSPPSDSVAPLRLIPSSAQEGDQHEERSMAPEMPPLPIEQDRAPAPAPITAEAPRPVPAPRPGPVAVPPPPARVSAAPETTGDISVTRTLRTAAERGASIVYLVAQSRPIIRVNGEMNVLEDEPVVTEADVHRVLADLAAPGAPDRAETEAAEWMCDLPEIGRVRYLTFRDHRGPGVIFRMTPARAISAEQLDLSPEVQALGTQPDGLVVVTGVRASGKSTLLSAFVDLINRTRSDHVITIESQIGFVHHSKRSFISQREVRDGGDTIAAAARRALREDPDVLFVEELASADVLDVALEAAEEGRLVFGSVHAPSATAAIEQIMELFPAERRAKARALLAASLRGVIAQVLLRKLGGGRIAAREVLINTPAVASTILEGKTFQMQGRRHGMVPLNDALAALVRDGTVHIGEAYRKAVDRDALLAMLKREGVDTSFAERLA